MTHISDAFEDLAHGLRILLEADYHARAGLLRVDRAEAVGNIENALAGVLNAFSSLYDSMAKEGMAKVVDWYKTPELATILVLRNARHHNHARKIRTLYSYYAQEARKMGSMETYILVDYPAEEDGADTFDVYLSWADLKSLFAMPRKVTLIREETEGIIRQYIGTEKFATYARSYELKEERVFFNVIPLLVNAGVKLVPHLKGKVTPRSTESETYLTMFDGLILPASTSNHEVACGPIALMP